MRMILRRCLIRRRLLLHSTTKLAMLKLNLLVLLDEVLVKAAVRIGQVVLEPLAVALLDKVESEGGSLHGLSEVVQVPQLLGALAHRIPSSFVQELKVCNAPEPLLLSFELIFKQLLLVIIFFVLSLCLDAILFLRLIFFDDVTIMRLCLLIIFRTVS